LIKKYSELCGHETKFKNHENANLASMKSNSCHAHFCEKGIFSHDLRLGGAISELA
jgi:hypothetical protein